MTRQLKAKIQYATYQYTGMVRKAAVYYDDDGEAKVYMWCLDEYRGIYDRTPWVYYGEFPWFDTRKEAEKYAKKEQAASEKN